MVDDVIVRAMFEEHIGRAYAFDNDNLSGAAPEAPPGGVAITLRGLTKAFGDQSVLHGIDLHIPAGQFLTIVGRSGCGKSTLLRILAGLDRPTQGSVQFDGLVQEQSDHVARLMFQEPRLLPWSSVLGNVEVGLGARRRAPNAQSLARSKLAEVGLERRADEWPSVLSGGQRQRVALARALASRPQFLALDEPLGALDALTRLEMQDLIEEVWRAQGFTAILVTHDVAEAVRLADRIVVLDQGRIVETYAIEHARPRPHGDAELGRIEQRILDRLMRRKPS